MKNNITMEVSLCMLLLMLTGLLTGPVYAAQDVPLGLPLLEEKIDRNYESVTALPEVIVEKIPQVINSPAHTTWLVPNYFRRARVLDDGSREIYLTTNINVLNTGAERAHFRCILMQPIYDRVLTQDVSTPGGWVNRGCVLFPTNENRLDAWVLVTSDIPVIVNAQVSRYSSTFLQTNGRDGSISTHPVKTYPIDCSNPAGIEEICQVLEDNKE